MSRLSDHEVKQIAVDRFKKKPITREQRLALMRAAGEAVTKAENWEAAAGLFLTLLEEGAKKAGGMKGF